MAAAKRHNYRPNTRAIRLATGARAAARSAMSSRWPPGTRSSTRSSPVRIAGAGETYSRNDYDMVLSVVSDADEETTYRTLRSKGNVDGVILHAPRLDDPRIPLARDRPAVQ